MTTAAARGIIGGMNYFLFDLDGTLTDPQEGITGCVQSALAAFGIEERREDLRKFIGPPLKEAFMDFYGFSEEDAERAAALYRVRFVRQGVFENAPYEGIEDVLSALKAGGAHLAVASSKPEVFVRQILSAFSLEGYFDAIVGAAPDGAGGEKSAVIGRALKALGAGKAETVMVGDRKYDVAGAKANGLLCVGAGYGFAEAGELEAAGADIVAKTVEDLGNVLKLLQQNHG